MSNPLRFGTLGAAGITPQALMMPAAENDDVTVDAVAARDRSRAETFAEAIRIARVYDQLMTRYRNLLWSNLTSAISHHHNIR